MWLARKFELGLGCETGISLALELRFILVLIIIWRVGITQFVSFVRVVQNMNVLSTLSLQFAELIFDKSFLLQFSPLVASLPLFLLI